MGDCNREGLLGCIYYYILFVVWFLRTCFHFGNSILTIRIAVRILLTVVLVSVRWWEVIEGVRFRLIRG